MLIMDNEKSIDINNISISYTDSGPRNGAVIILIHGFPLNKSMWDKQVLLLQENYRVIAYDVRGHGKSNTGINIFSIALFVQDLIGLMNTLAIKKATLCGLSMGGYIALNAIENYPDRFEGLILCDTNCLEDTPIKKENRTKTIDKIKEQGIEQFAKDSTEKFFTQGSFASRKEEILAVRKMIRGTSEESLTLTMNALANREETCSKLSKIKVPVLIMVGKEDKITPLSDSEWMQKKIINSFLKIIENAGHLSNLENPKDFNNHLSAIVSLIYNKGI